SVEPRAVVAGLLVAHARGRGAPRPPPPGAGSAGGLADAQGGHVVRHRERGLKEGVAVAAGGVVERDEPLDDGVVAGAREAPHATALAQLAPGDVWQPVGQRAEPADELPHLVGRGRNVDRSGCLCHVKSPHAGKSAPTLVPSHASNSRRRASSFSRAIRSASLPRSRWSGGFGDSTAWMIAFAARTGSPGCLPLSSRNWRRTAPAVAA